MTDTSAQTTPTRRLTRSLDDRVIAGVCGGLAEYTGIDPMVFRIGFAVTALAGGGGILAYVLAWALIPEEGRPAHDWASPPVVVGIIAVAVMVGLPALFLSVIFGHDLGWLLPVGILVLIFSSPRRRAWRSWQREGFRHRAEWRGQRYGTAPWPPPTAATVDGPPSSPPGAGTSTADATTVVDPPGRATPPPFWPPPSSWSSSTPPPPPAPLPPRERSRLGRITMSVAVLAVGGLALIDAIPTRHIGVDMMLAVVLLVVAAGLLVGSLFGRARSLIALGIPLAVATLVATSTPGGGIGDRTWRPLSERELHRHYDLTAGQADLDLSYLASLDGTRHVDVRVGFGHVSVVLPNTFDVDLDASVRAGDLSINGGAGAVDGSGFRFGFNDNSNSRHERVHYDGPGSGRLVLDVHLGFGDLSVVRVTESTVPPPGGGVEWVPTSAGDLAPSYEAGAGDVRLDLRRVHGVVGEQSTRVDVGTGDIRVVLPTDVDVDVIASTDVGRVDLPDHDPLTGRAVEQRGIYDTPGTGRLVLTLHTGVGDVEVSK